MACDEDSLQMFCDAEGCTCVIKLQARPQSEQHRVKRYTGAEGWLFVKKNDQRLYYCPDCAPKILASLQKP